MKVWEKCNEVKGIDLPLDKDGIPLENGFFRTR